MDEIETLAAALEAGFGRKLRRNEPLAAHTTLRLGGPADLWLPATSAADLAEAVLLARRQRVPVFILGSGANLLVGDLGLRGLVISNRAEAVAFQADGVLAESGVNLPGLARRCARRGLSGLEWAVGVPGTVGGAVVNNAGAYGRDMAATLRRAELLAPDGQRVWQPASWFDYAYRYSRLKGSRDYVVLQAELDLAPADPMMVESQMAAFNERRKASQPPGATLGSMFKNPPGDYAGRLIEAAGLKGYQIGGAQISAVHANFFVNLGHASAGDVLALLEAAQQTVQEKFGVKLELEIEVVGE